MSGSIYEWKKQKQGKLNCTAKTDKKVTSCDGKWQTTNEKDKMKETHSPETIAFVL